MRAALASIAEWLSWPQACMWPAVCGSEVEAGVLVDRQGVHVAAQQHGPARPGPVQQGDEAAGRLAVADRQRQAGERGFQLRRGARTIEPKLGIGMDGAAQRQRRVLLGFRRGAPVADCLGKRHGSSR